MTGDESKKHDLAIEAVGEVVAAAVPVPGVALATRALISNLMDRFDARRARLLEEFLDRLAEEERFGSREEAARLLEEGLGEHEDALMRLIRSVFDAVNSAALPPLARLYGLHRRGLVEPRVWRRTLRLLVEADAGAIDAMALLTAAVLTHWPSRPEEELQKPVEAVRVHLTGLRVTVTLLPDMGSLERMVSFSLNHHEHADEAFDLLTDHFFRFEGPVPHSGGYTQLGGHRSEHGLAFNCLRSDLDFLSRVIGPQRRPAPGGAPR